MFKTKSGQRIPAVTEDQMREVDRIAFGSQLAHNRENCRADVGQLAGDRTLHDEPTMTLTLTSVKLRYPHQTRIRTGESV